MGNLSHLDELEAEAIYIIREVAAEFEKPVMLYSIGKDSSVMLHLAMKAFYPEKPPFPFLHVDTTWKFKEMIEFRDKMAKKLGIDLIVYTNEDGVKKGINPFDHGSAYTDIMKTQALKQALDKYQFTAAFGGGRRDEEKSRAKERIFSILPEEQKEELIKLFDEFEAFETAESKFAHAMDNLQPLILNNSNGGGDWREHGVTARQVYGRQSKTKLGSERLYEVTDKLIQENINKGNIKAE